MADKVQKPCRVCGKMFTPCADCENDRTMFRWRKFACSLDCAKEYLSKIEESRQAKTESDTALNGEVVFSETAGTDIIKAKNGRKKI